MLITIELPKTVFTPPHGVGVQTFRFGRNWSRCETAFPNLKVWTPTRLNLMALAPNSLLTQRWSHSCTSIFYYIIIK